MPKTLYSRVPVRDGLAAERTVLAAERTFLAYVRTAFAMLITGLTGAHLLTDPTLVSIGYVLTAVSALVFVVGIYRYAASRSETRKMLVRLEQEEEER